MKKAFTLIELLVVVLIIGILAGAAMSQYQSAVVKSKIVEAVLNLKAIANAQERYILENGVSVNKDFSRLDISFNDSCKTTSCVIGKNVYAFPSTSGAVALYFDVTKVDFSALTVLYFFEENKKVGVKKGEYVCIPRGKKTWAATCRSIAGPTMRTSSYFDGGTSYIW